MWFAGLLIGALVGGALGDVMHWSDAWMFFGAVGLVVGILYGNKTRDAQAQWSAGTLERRVALLEKQVAELTSRTGAAPVTAAAASTVETPSQPEPAPPPPVTAFPADAADVHLVQTLAQAAEATPAAQPTASPTRAPRPPSEPSWLWQKLFGGNILAKVGVLLLFFGIASGMKLVVDYGLFPPSLRLLLGTVAGIAMIGFGFSRVLEPRHRMFGLALQGGGFGVLYLVTYFALSWYRYIDPVMAFGLFAALGIACVVVAVHFEGEPLAILGLSGAFLAPLLASTGAGSHLVLFSYYAVIDVLVLVVYWTHAWRALTVLAFVFTLGVGMTWASLHFTRDTFATTEAFLVLFSVMFSIAPFASALAKRPQDHWAETALLFGTPVAAAFAQNWLVQRAGYDDIVLAWCAVGAGLYYSALTAVLVMRRATEAMRHAYAAVAISFFTIAVPLAFGAQVTSAFWAIEGLALTWFGVANRRPLAFGTGLLLQVVAGAYFMAHWHGTAGLAVLNGRYVGCLIIAACGACSAWIARREIAPRWIDKDLLETFSALIGFWGLVWWLAANFSEIERFAAPAHQMALHIAVAIGTAWALSAAGQAVPWREARYTAIALAALAVLAGACEGLIGADYYRHPLHDTMIFALPAAFVTLYALLHLHERDQLTGLLRPLHVFALLVLSAVLLRESLWVAYELARNVKLWPVLAWQMVPAAIVYGVVYLDRSGTWPLATQRPPYLAAAAPVLLGVAFVAALNANLNHTGGGSALPYIPFASFFDVVQIAVIAAFAVWLRAARPHIRSDLMPIASGAAPVLAFLWLSAMAMRIAHHWGHVPFQAKALLASGIAQSMLSLLWTSLALALMISATRKVLRQRWFTGFVLLGIVGAKFVLVDVVNKGTITWTLSLLGVGVLILAASYFSPAPPRAASEPALSS